MNENSELLYNEDIKDLREKTEKDYVNNKLKSTPFGGYNKKDVLDFIAELRDRELKAREIFTSRIGELTATIESLQNEQSAITSALSKANELKNSAQTSLDELTNKYETLKINAENADKTIDAYEKKLSIYEAQVKILKTDYEEVQSAKKYRDLYEKLTDSYNEIADSREKYIKSDAKLTQENEHLKSQNERLNSENELLSKNLSDITAVVRKAGLNANMKLGAYDETHKYLLGNLIKYAEGTLKYLKELEEKENELTAGVNEDLKPLRNI